MSPHVGKSLFASCLLTLPASCWPLFLQKATKVGGVKRLTDTSKYTGSHKARFDESGKGKGLAGRPDWTDNSGYVGAYKGAGTYDQTH